jgi:acrylyl-CoA reductase (NADPH)
MAGTRPNRLYVKMLGIAASGASPDRHGTDPPHLVAWAAMASETFTAFTATAAEAGVTRAIGAMSVDELPPDGVLIEVERSSVNFKDGLATTANGKVARISPLIPGIDLAGIVRESGDDAFPVGCPVIAHGYDLGVSRHGGYAQLARVPAEWLVPCPPGLDLREAMTIGTAGSVRSS